MKKYIFCCLLIEMLAQFSFAEQQASTGVVVKIKNSDHKIVFRQLPRNENILPLVSTAANPKNAADSKQRETLPAYERQVNTAYDIPLLYLAEKELSLSEVKLLVSSESWEHYQNMILGPSGPDGSRDHKLGMLGPGDKPIMKRYKEGVEIGSRDLPAILIEIPLLIEICKSLNKSAVVYDQALQPGLEASFFRAPTRREWQFAARAIEVRDSLNVMEYFPGWTTFDKRMQSDYGELRSGINKPASVSTPTQQEFVENIDEYFNRGGGKRDWGYKQLGYILQRVLQLDFDLADRQYQGLYSLEGPPPNAWGFHRMFGNASEWTLHQESVRSADQFWQAMLSKSSSKLQSQADVLGVVMGGTTMDIYRDFGCWKTFSIAHGIDNEGQPFEVRHCFAKDEDDKINKKFKDLKAGVRILLRRRLHPQWFVAFRKDVLTRSDYQVLNEKFSNLFERVCTKAELLPKTTHLALYDRLENKRIKINEIGSNEGDWWDEITPMELQAEENWWNTTTPLILRVAHSYRSNSDTKVADRLAKFRARQKQKAKKSETSSDKKKETNFEGFGHIGRKLRKSKKSTGTKADYFALLAEIDGVKPPE